MLWDKKREDYIQNNRQRLQSHRRGECSTNKFKIMKPNGFNRPSNNIFYQSETDLIQIGPKTLSSKKNDSMVFRIWSS